MVTEDQIRAWLIDEIMNNTPSSLEELYTYHGSDPELDDVTQETCNIHPNGSFDGDVTVTVNFSGPCSRSYSGSYKGKHDGDEFDIDASEFEFDDPTEDEIP